MLAGEQRAEAEDLRRGAQLHRAVLRLRQAPPPAQPAEAGSGCAAAVTRRPAVPEGDRGQLQHAARAHAAGAERRERTRHERHELRDERLRAAERTAGAGSDAAGRGERRWRR